jgi:diguanylate cyclase (GGDEF)-like protein/PAS domain S-box-containing protein
MSFRQRVRTTRMSVRSQLLVAFLISTGLIGALVVLASSQSFDSARRNAESQVITETNSQAQGLQSTLRSIPQYLRSIVAQRSVRSLDPATCRTQLQELGQVVSGVHIVIVNKSGRVVCSDGSLPGVTSIGQPSWLTRTFGGATGVGGPVTDPTTKQPDVTISIAFRAKSGRSVALVAMAGASSLLSMTAHNNVDPYLVDLTTGRVFDADPSADRLIGWTVDRAQLSRLLHTERPMTASDVDGTKRITAAMRIPGTHWAMLGGLPYDAAMAPARHDLFRNLDFGGAIVLALLALGAFLHRRITRPLYRLRRAMEHVGTDSVGTRAPVTGPAEFVDLAQAFNIMLDARARSEARFRSLARYDSDFVAVANPDGRITYANQRVAAAFSIDVEHGPPVSFIHLVHPQDRRHVLRLMEDWRQAPQGLDSSAEFRLVTNSGDVRHVEAHVQNLIGDYAVQGLIITCIDITERKSAEDRLTRAALHDSLTGLPNRTLVMARLEHVLERGQRDNTMNAVLFLDLDSFKLINDTAGHSAGDSLLIQVSERLSASLRPGDTLGRLGGDEFVVVCENLDSPEDALVIAERLVDARNRPYVVNGQEVYIGGSIGIAIARPEDTASNLLRDADVAMYRAKADGRGSVCVFDDAMRVETHNRLDIENALQRSTTADSSRSKRSRVGRWPTARASPRTTSSRSPKRPVSSSTWGTGCSRRAAASWPRGPARANWAPMSRWPSTSRPASSSSRSSRTSSPRSSTGTASRRSGWSSRSPSRPSSATRSPA